MQRFCPHWMSEILPIPTWGAAVVLNGYNHGDNFSNLGYEAPYNSGDSGVNMGVSKNRGTPKLSILMGFSAINHPFLGTPHLWKPPYLSISIVCPCQNHLFHHEHHGIPQ